MSSLHHSIKAKTSQMLKDQSVFSVCFCFIHISDYIVSVFDEPLVFSTILLLFLDIIYCKHTIVSRDIKSIRVQVKLFIFYSKLIIRLSKIT